MTIKNRLTRPYKEGVNLFIEFAMKNLGSEEKIQCPCVDCLNGTKHTITVVKIHLIRRGISPYYKTWVYHGEHVFERHHHFSNDDEQSIGDGMRGESSANQDGLHEMLKEIYAGEIENDDIDNFPDSYKEEDFTNFDKLFEDAQHKARMVNNFPFSEDERQNIKLRIQSSLYGYLGILLEGREWFEEEWLTGKMKKRIDEPGPSRSCGKLNGKNIYSISPRLKDFSDWLLQVRMSGNLDIIFPAASCEYAPRVEELWKDRAFQAT